MFLGHSLTPAHSIVVRLSFAFSSLVIACPQAQAQDAVVRVDENLRADPNGAILGQLGPGTPVSVEGQQGDWSEVTVRGFVFMPSLQVWTEGPLDLVVSSPDGENLRDAPSGRVLGRLNTDTLLEEVERFSEWIEVRRVAWIFTSSLDEAPAAVAAVRGEPGVSAQVAEPIVLSESAGMTEGWLAGGSRAAPILATPEGDTLGHAEPGSELRVLGREGSWARVQMEGWVWVPGLVDDGGGDGTGGELAVLSGVRVADLSMDAASYEGRVVELDLQFISLERAERLRTDFIEGEPFLLTRSREGNRTFVYVTVPPERLSQVEGIAPLQEIRVVGRVRSVAAAFTGNPILDLVEIERRP